MRNTLPLPLQLPLRALRAVALWSLAGGLGAGCLPPAAPQPLYEEATPVPPPQVTVTGTRLVLNQAIFFEFDQDRILPVSYPILDELAFTLRAHPRIQHVRIEGHTDNVGRPSYNLNLSFRRAQAVMQYLVRRGVRDDRLHSAGFGQEQPVADNDTETGRARNRRVSFVIEQWQPPAGALKAQR